MLNLKNNLLSVEIETPEEGYLGSRFDQLGKIIQVTCKSGYNYLTRESLNPNGQLTKGKGLIGEFGIDRAIGYDTCEIGGYFPKPGVGLLKKISNEPYDFFFPYERIPFESRVEQLNDFTILFTSVCSHSEYPFTYTKRISLVDRKIIVDYTFINSGLRTIVTNEYLHNFLAFTLHGASQSNPTLSFTQDVNQAVFLSGLNPDNCLSFSPAVANTLSIQKIAPSDLFFNDLLVGNDSRVAWCYTNGEAHSCSETVDFVPDKVNLWGAAHVISPEIFKSLTINSLESAIWQRTFEFNSTTN